MKKDKAIKALIAPIEKWSEESADHVAIAFLGNTKSGSCATIIAGDEPSQVANIIFSAMLNNEQVEQLIKFVATTFDEEKKRITVKQQYN